jgi:hypothetical protein
MLTLMEKAKNIKEYCRRRRKYWRWLRLGKPLPPPHEVKQMTVIGYAKRCGTRVFIETGTYLGDMVRAVRNTFHQIYSIELSAELCKDAQKQFSDYRHISILEGDSAKVLPEILCLVEEPCLFWLDGHYSGGITVKGNKETPILEELKHILGHSIAEHVILVDDARCFVGQNGYPTLEELRRLVLTEYPDYVFEVKDDMVRIHRNTQSCVWG